MHYFFIFRHYSLFFQKYENVINSLQFSKTIDYFRKFLREIQFFCRRDLLTRLLASCSQLRACSRESTVGQDNKLFSKSMLSRKMLERPNICYIFAHSQLRESSRERCSWLDHRKTNNRRFPVYMYSLVLVFEFSE